MELRQRWGLPERQHALAALGLRGLGITSDPSKTPDGWAVEVFVRHPSHAEGLPSHVAEVPVVATAIGDRRLVDRLVDGANTPVGTSRAHDDGRRSPRRILSRSETSGPDPSPSSSGDYADYTTEPDDVVRPGPAGWAKVGNHWQSLEPLRDRKTGLYARPTYAGGKEALARLGLRLPTPDEVDARRQAVLAAAGSGAIELPVIALPDSTMRADAGAKDDAAIQKMRDSYKGGMSSLWWARHFDELMAQALARRGWNGRSLVSNLGKMWIAGASEGSPAPGKALLKGWWDPNLPNRLGGMGRWTQEGTAKPGEEFHTDAHHDYATLLYAVSDTDPTTGARTDPNGDTTGAPNLADNPPQPEGYKGLPQSEVTPAMAAWAKAMQADSARYPMFSSETKAFPMKEGLVAIQARVEWHPPDTRNGKIHRGVSLAKHLWPPAHPKPEDLNPVTGQPWAVDPLTIPSGGGGTSPAPPPPLPGDMNPVWLIGDSLAGRLKKPLERLAAARGVNLATSYMDGTNVADWLSGARGTTLASVLANAPKLVLVSLGANELGNGEAAGRRTGELMDKLLAAGNGTTKVAWIAPPTMHTVPGNGAAWRKGLLEAAQKRGVRVFGEDKGTDLYLERDDKIHPTERSSESWAEVIAQWVPFSAYGSSAAPAAAPALTELAAELTARWPKRKLPDGILAGERHHADNPLSQHEIGDAIDIATDRVNGPNLDELAKALLEDPRTHYVIWRRFIANVERGDDAGRRGGWRPYAGASTHEDHLHLSIYDDRRDDTRPWDLSAVSTGAWTPGQAKPPAASLGTMAREPEPGPTPAPPTPPSPTPPPPAPAPDGFTLRSPVYVQKFSEPMPIETYVARVVTGEGPPGAGEAAMEGRRALAVAARTYVAHAMKLSSSLGTAANPIRNSDGFQVVAKTADPLAVRAADDTQSVVLAHDGKLMLGNHVAGSVWKPGASSGATSDKVAPTERLVTYNEGLEGAAVKKAPNGGPTADNRGGLSQNGAYELARQGKRADAILRFFYGADADLVFRGKDGNLYKVGANGDANGGGEPAPAPPTPPEPPTPPPNPPPAPRRLPDGPFPAPPPRREPEAARAGFGADFGLFLLGGAIGAAVLVALEK